MSCLCLIGTILNVTCSHCFCSYIYLFFICLIFFVPPLFLMKYIMDQGWVIKWRNKCLTVENKNKIILKSYSSQCLLIMIMVIWWWWCLSGFCVYYILFASWHTILGIHNLHQSLHKDMICQRPENLIYIICFKFLPFPLLCNVYRNLIILNFNQLNLYMISHFCVGICFISFK